MIYCNNINNAHYSNFMSQINRRLSSLSKFHQNAYGPVWVCDNQFHYCPHLTSL